MKQQTDSHINSRRRVTQSLKETVCAWLHWDEMEYSTFQYESGLAYLRHYIPQDKWGQDMLQRSRLFWNWWKNQWSHRDASFCDGETEAHLNKITVKNLRRLYYHMHDAAALASEIYPGRTVLDDTYCTMIDQLNKEGVHA